jgi:DNA-binding GntR family transcriptional regulator
MGELLDTRLCDYRVFQLFTLYLSTFYPRFRGGMGKSLPRVRFRRRAWKQTGERILRDLTVAEIADQYEIRTALETYVLRTLAGKLTPDQSARLRENLRAQAALPDNAPVARGVALESEFHMLFCEFLGNGEILGLMDNLREKIARVMTTVFKVNPVRVQTSYQEHRAIAEAVISGDGATAARLIDRHLEVGKQLLLSPRRC